MSPFDSFFTGSYESFLLEGDHTYVFPLLQKDVRFSKASSRIYAFTQIGIDDVREMVKEMALKTWGGEERVIAIGAGEITREAQNALLKFLEEPKTTTRILLVVPRASLLLPTVRSRVSFLGEMSSSDGDLSIIKDFLKKDISLRLTYTAKRLKETEESSTMRQELLADVKNMILYFRTLSHPASQKALQELEKAGEVLGTRGVPVKTVFEHLALVLPSV